MQDDHDKMMTTVMPIEIEVKNTLMTIKMGLMITTTTTMMMNDSKSFHIFCPNAITGLIWCRFHSLSSSVSNPLLSPSSHCAWLCLYVSLPVSLSLSLSRTVSFITPVSCPSNSPTLTRVFPCFCLHA